MRAKACNGPVWRVLRLITDTIGLRFNLPAAIKVVMNTRIFPNGIKMVIDSNRTKGARYKSVALILIRQPWTGGETA